MPSMQSMKEKLLRKNTSGNENTNQERVYRPDDPQEVNLNVINVGEEVKIRFVEDGDKSNDFFWRAYCYHDLTFRGVKGDASKENVITTVRVPAYNISVDKYGNKSQYEGTELNVPQASVYNNFQDPIQKYLKDNKLFEQTDRKVIDATGHEITLYNALKRKVQYFCQGYIMKAPESLTVYQDARPLKHFRLKESIIKDIIRFITDEDTIDDDPLSLTNGVDYNYRKTQQGQFNNYDTSSFGRAKTAVPEAYAEDFARYGADFIGDRIPKTPTEQQRIVIQEMLDAFLGGLPYDPKWDELGYYKFTRQPKNNNAEPTWNSPMNSYQEPSADEIQMQKASQVVQDKLTEIVGSNNVNINSIEHQVNDSIPYGGTPTMTAPTAQVNPVGTPTYVVPNTNNVTPLSKEDTLAVLKSMNN